MSSQYRNDPMQEVFIFETSQQLEQVEQSVILTESLGHYSGDTINEIFRIMHTIKSSAAMMLLNHISALAHSTEDLFYFIREEKPQNIDIPTLSDLLLEGMDFMKLELEKIKNGEEADGESDQLIEKMKQHLAVLRHDNDAGEMITEQKEPVVQQYYISTDKSGKTLIEPKSENRYKAIVKFQEDCGMENIRAFTITHNLKDITENFRHIPEDILDDSKSIETIAKDGFIIYIKTDQTYEFLKEFFMQSAYLEELTLTQLEDEEEFENIGKQDVPENEIKVPRLDESANGKDIPATSSSQGQSIISVSVDKLDKLMNLVGEMVIAEAMVTQNPDLQGLMLDNFSKAARQLKKITGEMQDTVMSIRMLPLGPTFFKMNRIIRDISKKLDKEINLSIIGEDTEVDKNIIEHIGDPLMHLVRNAADHGIETRDVRESKGKPSVGTITLEAKNAGSEVLIIIKDDGKGLNKDMILKKAMENELLRTDPEEMSDKEIFNLIFLAGFSTKEAVTEFSGRGVGMDVVAKNIEMVGGSIMVESVEGAGTTITLKIPLTLAIIDGMNIRVGKSRYTLPIVSIKESFRPKPGEAFKDPDGNEMIMIRGKCYKILRLHHICKVKTEVTDLEKGILIMVEGEYQTVCLFADELIGEQQVVVKALPKYISKIKKISGLAGCTLLGNGSISLILDVDRLISRY